MKSSDLRVGNLFNTDFEMIEIRRNAKLGSSKKGDYYHSVIIENELILKQVKLSYLKSIELTREWAVKLGFEKDSDNVFQLPNIDCYIHFRKIGIIFNYYDNNVQLSESCKKKIEFVHELQNICNEFKIELTL